MKTRPASIAAFSLVEVVFAIGIVAFCLLSVLALMPLGVATTHDSLQNTTASGIAAAISADIHSVGTGTATPRFGISVGANPNTPTVLFFGGDDSSALTTPVTVGAVSLYRATVTSGTVSPSGTQSVRIQVTWPALADPNPAKSPANYTGSIDVVTAFNTNSP